MLVISFGVFFYPFLEEQSVVRLWEICFPFALQVGETKPYGKNVSAYDISICWQVMETVCRAELKYRKARQNEVCKRAIITAEIVLKFKAAAGMFVCHGMCRHR